MPAGNLCQICMTKRASQKNVTVTWINCDSNCQPTRRITVNLWLALPDQWSSIPLFAILISEHAAKTRIHKEEDEPNCSLQFESQFIQVTATFFWLALLVIQIWHKFPAGPVHDLCKSLSAVLCRILPAAHALTGCDTTSAMFGIGKKSVYKLLGVRWFNHYSTHYVFILELIVHIQSMQNDVGISLFLWTV
jgi:hypothetical protein